MTSILPLQKIGKGDVSAAGGKGAHLGELIKSGFPVPEGFVIATSVYDSTIAKSKDAIRRILSGIDTENNEELQAASSRIRAIIASAEIPEKDEKEIMSAYRKLGSLVAVRSSATAEDQKEASFAGQMDTFLNVKEENLIESVKKCFASAFSARAIYYRHQKKIGHMKVLMAVVVQKMVLSRKAGVAFSINPVSNDETEIVVEAARGLGEAVVGGQTTPDNYVIDKESSKLKESRVRGDFPVLSGPELRKIASTVNEISRHNRFPQDVEWAIDDKNRLYILQSRPVTTLQVRKKPTWEKILAREYGVQYTELSVKCLSPLNKHIAPYTFYGQAYIPEDGNEACYILEKEWNDFVSALKEKWVDNLANYEQFEKAFIRCGSEYAETAKAISQASLKAKSSQELKEMYVSYLKKNLAYGPFIWMQFLINNFFSEKAKEVLEGKLGKDSKNLHDYLGIALKPEKKAASIRLSEVAASWESLSKQEKAQAYDDFRWIPCLDIHNRPWTKEAFSAHIKEFKKSENKLQATYEEMLREIKPSEAERQVLGIARRLSYLKDLKDDFRRQGIFYGQKLFDEIGSRMGCTLEDTSYMTEEELLEFLDTGKTVPKRLVKERKNGFAIYFNRNKKIECKSGKDVKNALNELGIIMLEDYSEELKGTPASSGAAKGTAVIVRGVSDLRKVKRGDILVAVTTHPDYVPAMQRAAAIITDEGGITSHAAIIARELGLPCIVGMKTATKSIKDGDVVEVDADFGFVRKVRK